MGENTGGNSPPILDLAMEVTDITNQPQDLPNQNKSTKASGNRFDNPSKYLRAFKGPYDVIVEKLDDTPLRDVQVGKWLMQNNITKVQQLTRTGRKRVRVTFQTPETANNFLQHTLLKDHNLGAFTPRELVQRNGVVRNVPIDIDLDEITKNLHCFQKILNVERLHRRVIK